MAESSMTLSEIYAGIIEDADEDDELSECDYCGGEVQEGTCESCGDIAILEQVIRLEGLLPPHLSVKQVQANHSKPCSDCGRNDWFYGDWYVYDCIDPRCGDKYCLDCAAYIYSDSFENEDDSASDLCVVQIDKESVANTNQALNLDVDTPIVVSPASTKRRKLTL